VLGECARQPEQLVARLVAVRDPRRCPGGPRLEGKRLFAFSHRRRSHGDDPLCPREGRGQRPMDQRAAREEAGAARLGCGRQ
jgi:hypothetical protein